MTNDGSNNDDRKQNVERALASNDDDASVDEELEAEPLPEKPGSLKEGADLDGIRKFLLAADQTGEVRAKRINLTIARRTPNKHEWIQVHPEHAAQAVVLKLKPTNDTYLVSSEFRLELQRHLTPVELRLAVNTQGGVFIWPVRIPAADRADDWGYSALDAMQMAQTEWIRLEPDMQSQAYVINTAPFHLEPAWPEEPFEKLLSLAFKRFLIDREDHPILRRLRGDAP